MSENGIKSAQIVQLCPLPQFLQGTEHVVVALALVEVEYADGDRRRYVRPITGPYLGSFRSESDYLRLDAGDDIFYGASGDDIDPPTVNLFPIWET